jgi:hypothetical protein
LYAAACHSREDAWQDQPVASFFLKLFAVLSSIGPNSDHLKAIPLHEFLKKRFSAQKIPVFGLLLLAPLGACEPAADAELLPTPVAKTAPEKLSCGENGALQGSLIGGIEAAISWTAGEMVCESMPRPNGEGIRLRFAGKIGDEHLAIIVAMPAFVAGAAGVEVPSNVTATVEGSGRFFSTPGLESCWTEISAQTALAERDGSYAVDGTLFCIAPLGELNGDAAVTIPELTFSTIVNWKN